MLARCFGNAAAESSALRPFPANTRAGPPLSRQVNRRSIKRINQTEHPFELTFLAWGSVSTRFFLLVYFKAAANTGSAAFDAATTRSRRQPPSPHSRLAADGLDTFLAFDSKLVMKAARIHPKKKRDHLPRKSLGAPELPQKKPLSPPVEQPKMVPR